LLENNNAPLLKVLLDRLKVRQKESDLLFGTALGATPEQDERGFICRVGCQQSAEIGIRRHDDAVFGRGPCKDSVVVRSLHPIVSNMDGIVSCLTQRV